MVETVECGDIHEEEAVLYEDRIGFAGINQGAEFIFCPGRCCNFLCCDSSGPNSLPWEAKPVMSLKGCAQPPFLLVLLLFTNCFFPSSPWTVEVPKLCKKGFK